MHEEEIRSLRQRIAARQPYEDLTTDDIDDLDDLDRLQFEQFLTGLMDETSLASLRSMITIQSNDSQHRELLREIIAEKNISKVGGDK